MIGKAIAIIYGKGFNIRLPPIKTRLESVVG